LAEITQTEKENLQTELSQGEDKMC
jgi:hypothetical protein